MFENELARKAIIIAVTCVIALVLQSIATRAVRHVFDRGNVPRGSIFINLTRALIWFIALLSILEPVFGVQPTGFVAALGVVSIAISLGLQDTISNILAGLGLMLTHVIEVGDWIEVGGYQGVVTDITWRATTIKALIGDIIVIPNAVLGSTTMRKLSPLAARSIVIPLDIHPDVDLAEVERQVRAAVEKAAAPYLDPELGIILFEQGYGSFGFRLDVRVGLRTMDDAVAARSAVAAACSGNPWLARW